MNYFTKDKPYNSLNEYYKSKYGVKIAKISLNGGFSCPNKDGTKGIGGCSYCSKSGSGDFAGDVTKPIAIQFKEIQAMMETKWKNSKYIAYFQANSNTYAPLEKLKALYEEALAQSKDIVGLAIATRPDCITEEIASYLEELNQRTDIYVELGLQTSNEATGIRIRRGLTNREFTSAVELLRKHHIEVIVHIINGLPGETKEDMLETISFLNQHDIQGIKFHSLLLLENTDMLEEYKENPFHILSLEEYVDITVEQITRLKDSIIIHRLAADGKEEDLVEPLWTRKKLVVMNEIDKKMRKENLYQGMKKEATQ